MEQNDILVVEKQSLEEEVDRNKKRIRSLEYELSITKTDSGGVMKIMILRCPLRRNNLPPPPV